MEVCPVCSLKINGNVVLFSYGKPGTRERLHARVCQYTKREGCINRGVDKTLLTEKDFYD